MFHKCSENLTGTGICGKLEDHIVTQYWFLKSLTSPANIPSFFIVFNRKLDEEEAVEMSNLDFGKTFNSINHRIRMLKRVISSMIGGVAPICE